jgi:hypothetical protein
VAAVHEQKHTGIPPRATICHVCLKAAAMCNFAALSTSPACLPSRLSVCLSVGSLERTETNDFCSKESLDSGQCSTESSDGEKCFKESLGGEKCSKESLDGEKCFNESLGGQKRFRVCCVYLQGLFIPDSHVRHARGVEHGPHPQPRQGGRLHHGERAPLLACDDGGWPERACSLEGFWEPWHSRGTL